MRAVQGNRTKKYLSGSLRSISEPRAVAQTQPNANEQSLNHFNNLVELSIAGNFRECSSVLVSIKFD